MVRYTEGKRPVQFGAQLAFNPVPVYPHAHKGRALSGRFYRQLVGLPGCLPVGPERAGDNQHNPPAPALKHTAFYHNLHINHQSNG